MKMLKSVNWRSVAIVLSLLLVVSYSAVAAEAEPAKKGAKSFLETAMDAGFMEGILVLVSIAGFALCLQALVSLRVHLLRPPELANELINCCQEGNLDGAVEAAQSDGSFLGTVAFATLSNAQNGKEAMEGAMADAGDVESNKLMNKIGTLNLIAAIAPMLGLTGTTVGMIDTFSQMSAGGSEITADKMANGISIALICTFTGLMVAIPLLVVAYFLKAKVVQVIMEISNDCNELIRIITSGEQAEA